MDSENKAAAINSQRMGDAGRRREAARGVSLDPDKLAETDNDIWLECAARQKLSADAEGDNRTAA
jgi:hypothetical protein